MVELEVIYEKYERYGSGGVYRKIIKRDNLLDCLKVMVDNMRLYFNSEDIEEENMNEKEIIDRIYSENGDGCDFILRLKDLINDEVYIKEDYNYNEEEL